MTKQSSLQIFEEKKVRTMWDDKEEKWYFSVSDVVEVLTDSANPTDYFKKMRKREPELAAFVGTNCPHVEMPTASGKKRKTLVGDTKTIFRIIQSIPSPKAEPFKQWMANPQGFDQQKHIAKAGGSVAKAAKNQLESQLGHSVISPAKATYYILPQGEEE